MKKTWLIIVALLGCAFIPILIRGIIKDKHPGIPETSQPFGAMVRPAQRIVSLTLCTTKILCALGAEDMVVAITDSKSQMPVKAKNIPRVGRSFGQVNIEALLGFQPDFVFCWQNVADILQQKGIPVYIVNCKSLPDVLRLIKETGAITGRDKEARLLLNDLETRIETVKQKVARVETKPLVYFEGWGIGYTRAPGTLTHDLITLAGGINIAADQPVAYPLLSTEYIIQKNPDIIIVEKGWSDATIEEIKNRDGWDKIKAVRNNRVYRIEYSYYTDWAPECVEGIELFAKWFYPEVFQNESH